MAVSVPQAMTATLRPNFLSMVVSTSRTRGGFGEQDCSAHPSSVPMVRVRWPQAKLSAFSGRVQNSDAKGHQASELPAQS